MAPLLNDRLGLRRRLVAAFHAAQQHPLADGDRMAILGWGFGGLCALDLARAAPAGLRAAVSFYGPLTAPKLPQSSITASILILHGWEDPFATPTDVVALTRELTDAHADWQLCAYGHAKHAFSFTGATMPERGLLYNAQAAQRSWAAMTAFLNESLSVRPRQS
jgi:dienelactone hydrolase